MARRPSSSASLSESSLVLSNSWGSVSQSDANSGCRDNKYSALRHAISSVEDASPHKSCKVKSNSSSSSFCVVSWLSSCVVLTADASSLDDTISSVGASDPGVGLPGTTLTGYKRLPFGESSAKGLLLLYECWIDGGGDGSSKGLFGEGVLYALGL
eukprot:CAMPEP_0168846462 /NCGR_PEP_ID=MMETSP0727-20121128/9810_1 /TAXON_ID=265536 /ORGANISM="Amphiprora sp., Strain CCMP467" /LENGTH=155 /DNA_ID=CAMNT_0008900227 /DNA_START=81 /DNA_END=548 /DNA_ORIENTATION=+